MNPEEVISEFKENFEIDLKDDSYEKIDPVLPLGNSARFIHDFSSVRFLFLFTAMYFYLQFILF